MRIGDRAVCGDSVKGRWIMDPRQAVLQEMNQAGDCQIPEGETSYSYVGSNFELYTVYYETRNLLQITVAPVGLGDVSLEGLILCIEATKMPRHQREIVLGETNKAYVPDFIPGPPYRIGAFLEA